MNMRSQTPMERRDPVCNLPNASRQSIPSNVLAYAGVPTPSPKNGLGPTGEPLSVNRPGFCGPTQGFYDQNQAPGGLYGGLNQAPGGPGGFPGPPNQGPGGFPGPPNQGPGGFPGPPNQGPGGFPGPPNQGPGGYAGPPNQGPGGFSGPPNQGPGGFPGPPNQGPGGYAGPPNQGPGGFPGPPNQGPGGFSGPPNHGPGGYAGPPNQGPGGYAAPANLGPGGHTYPPNQAPGGHTYPPNQAPGGHTYPPNQGPGAVSLNQGPGVFNGPASQAPGGFNGPANQGPGGFNGPANQAPGEFKGLANQGPGGFNGPANQGPGGFNGPAHQAPGEFNGLANQGPGGFNSPANQGPGGLSCLQTTNPSDGLNGLPNRPPDGYNVNCLHPQNPVGGFGYTRPPMHGVGLNGPQTHDSPERLHCPPNQATGGINGPPQGPGYSVSPGGFPGPPNPGPGGFPGSPGGINGPQTQGPGLNSMRFASPRPGGYPDASYASPRPGGYCNASYSTRFASPRPDGHPDASNSMRFASPRPGGYSDASNPIGLRPRPVGSDHPIPNSTISGFTGPPNQAPVGHSGPPNQAPVGHSGPPNQAPVRHSGPPNQAPEAYGLNERSSFKQVKLRSSRSISDIPTPQQKKSNKISALALGQVNDAREVNTFRRRQSQATTLMLTPPSRPASSRTISPDDPPNTFRDVMGLDSDGSFSIPYSVPGEYEETNRVKLEVKQKKVKRKTGFGTKMLRRIGLMKKKSIFLTDKADVNDVHDVADDGAIDVMWPRQSDVADEPTAGDVPLRWCRESITDEPDAVSLVEHNLTSQEGARSTENVGRTSVISVGGSEISRRQSQKSTKIRFNIARKTVTDTDCMVTLDEPAEHKWPYIVVAEKGCPLFDTCEDVEASGWLEQGKTVWATTRRHASIEEENVSWYFIQIDVCAGPSWVSTIDLTTRKEVISLIHVTHTDKHFVVVRSMDTVGPSHALSKGVKKRVPPGTIISPTEFASVKRDNIELSFVKYKDDTWRLAADSENEYLMEVQMTLSKATEWVITNGMCPLRQGPCDAAKPTQTLEEGTIAVCRTKCKPVSNTIGCSTYVQFVQSDEQTKSLGWGKPAHYCELSVVDHQACYLVVVRRVRLRASPSASLSHVTPTVFKKGAHINVLRKILVRITDEHSEVFFELMQGGFVSLRSTKRKSDDLGKILLDFESYNAPDHESSRRPFPHPLPSAAYNPPLSPRKPKRQPAPVLHERSSCSSEEYPAPAPLPIQRAHSPVRRRHARSRSRSAQSRSPSCNRAGSFSPISPQYGRARSPHTTERRTPYLVAEPLPHYSGGYTTPKSSQGQHFLQHSQEPCSPRATGDGLRDRYYTLPEASFRHYSPTRCPMRPLHRPPPLSHAQYPGARDCRALSQGNVSQNYALPIRPASAYDLALSGRPRGARPICAQHHHPNYSGDIRPGYHPPSIYANPPRPLATDDANPQLVKTTTTTFIYYR